MIELQAYELSSFWHGVKLESGDKIVVRSAMNVIELSIRRAARYEYHRRAFQQQDGNLIAAEAEVDAKLFRAATKGRKTPVRLSFSKREVTDLHLVSDTMSCRLPNKVCPECQARRAVVERGDQ